MATSLTPSYTCSGIQISNTAESGHYYNTDTTGTPILVDTAQTLLDDIQTLIGQASITVRPENGNFIVNGTECPISSWIILNDTTGEISFLSDAEKEAQYSEA